MILSSVHLNWRKFKMQEHSRSNDHLVSKLKWFVLNASEKNINESIENEKVRQTKNMKTTMTLSALSLKRCRYKDGYVYSNMQQRTTETMYTTQSSKQKRSPDRQRFKSRLNVFSTSFHFGVLQFYVPRTKSVKCVRTQML